MPRSAKRGGVVVPFSREIQRCRCGDMFQLLRWLLLCCGIDERDTGGGAVSCGSVLSGRRGAVQQLLRWLRLSCRLHHSDPCRVHVPRRYVAAAMRGHVQHGGCGHAHTREEGRKGVVRAEAIRVVSGFDKSPSRPVPSSHTHSVANIASHRIASQRRCRTVLVLCRAVLVRRSGGVHDVLRGLCMSRWLSGAEPRISRVSRRYAWPRHCH